jgi:heme exporter protein B
VRRALAVAAKDLRSDARAKEIVPAMVLFALVLVFLFTFPLPPGAGRVPVPEPRAGAVGVREVSAAFLWASLLFAGVIGFGRSASAEREENRIEGLLLAPVDPAAVFAGKFLANLAYLVAMEVVLLPAFLLFFDVPAGNLFPGLVPVLLLADVGLAATGTLLGAASQEVRARELILPLLSFPAMLPIVLGAIRLTSSLLASGDMAGGGGWIVLLLATDVAYLAIGAVTFEYVVGE